MPTKEEIYVAALVDLFPGVDFSNIDFDVTGGVDKSVAIKEARIRAIIDTVLIEKGIVGGQPAPPPPTQTGLIAHWKFNETTGLIAKDSVGTNDLTITGAATWNNGSIKLNGGYLSRANVNLGLDGKTEYSVAFYIKSSAALGRIIQKEIADGDNTVYHVVEKPGHIIFDLWNTAAGKQPRWSNVTPVPFNNSFVHFAFTWKKNTGMGSDAILYINKKAVPVNFIPAGYDTSFVMKEVTKSIVIGARPVNFAEKLIGELKDFRIYNKIISATEVVAIP